MINEYSQGIMGDGVAILKNGLPMSPDDIVAQLSVLQQLADSQAHLIAAQEQLIAGTKKETATLVNLLATSRNIMQAIARHGCSKESITEALAPINTALEIYKQQGHDIMDPYNG